MNKIQKCGTPPGTLLYTGERRTAPLTITVIDYNKHKVHEEIITDLDKLKDYRERDTVTWINIDSLANESIIEKIGNIFGIHMLVLEDILNTDQRPKVDVHPNYIFITLKMLNYAEERDMFETEQLSLVFGANFIISFQEEAGDVFDIVREQIRKGGKVCDKGPDYLAYYLLDLVVDSYFKVMERMGEWIENLEAEVIKRPNRRRTFEINDLKRDMRFLRNHIWPVREVVHSLQRHEAGLISEDTNIYLGDLYDHSIQVMDNIETYRDMVANLMDLYLSNISYKMNEVMKTLTVVTTIFIPLTFITGLYGMNFKYMPELNYHYGYFIVLGLLLAVAGGMMIYFRRKGWF